MLFSNPFKTRLPCGEEFLPGRKTPIWNGTPHAVLRTPTAPPFPAEYSKIILGLGCFWGAERLFWQLDGVFSTAVGYAGGVTPNPTYEEVCSGQTGHTEVVLLVYNPAVIALESILSVFWEEHDPTQGFRQGNDIGTQYRSAIFYEDVADADRITRSASAYEEALIESGFGRITTEIGLLDEFFYAEEYHQQYLHKVPNGYCGLKGTGIACSTAKLSTSPKSLKMQEEA